MSLTECRDINGLHVKHGLMYMAGPGECHQCVCDNGVPKNCQDVMCHQPQNCSTFRKGARCCDFVCLDDLSSGKSDVVGFEGDFGLRLIASVITAVLSFSLLFFLVHRLRQRKIRSGRQSRQLSEDERSLGSIGYITGSLGYLPGAMERYEEPAAHFPHYPLWKPPGNYFPRGEAPPPYEEAVAATRAEALAAAMASGNLHTNPANFGRDPLLGVNYSTYATGNLLSGATHRTIPINLATSASFTLQPERFDENPPNTSCVSVATGTVSVTATVTAPPIARPDLLHSEIELVRQGTDSSSRSSTLRRSDMPPRPDSSHRPEGVRRTDINHRPDAFQWTEAPLRPDAGHRSDGVHGPETVHSADSSQRSDAGHRPDASNRIDGNLRFDNIHGAESTPRNEIIHHAEYLRSDGNHRPEINHRKENTQHLSHAHLDERSSLRTETHLRHEFGHRDVSHRESIWRPDDPIRGDERRLPSISLPENSHSLPPHHSHGIHHQPQNAGPTHLSHSYGRQHQVPAPPQELSGQDLDPKERKGTSSKSVLPHSPNVPKSGTGVYEDVFHAAPVDVPHLHIATLRRGKHLGISSNGIGTLRRNPVPVPTPTPKVAPSQPLPGDSTSSPPCVMSISSTITIPPPVIPQMEPQHNKTLASASPSAAVVAAFVASSPPRCTCPKAASPRCTCPGSCHSSLMSLQVNETSLPQNSNLSLAQVGLDDNDDYRSECENCKSTHSSNYYLDAEDLEPEITMTLHRKPTDTSEENGNGYYRTSLTLPTRHRPVPLHGSGARENWFSSMPETSSDEESDEE
ncbi:Integral membrane protein DGCR2/IDD [Frankliniella fusca]|uniref:Integral membrane protein DGCR2/IDD n=1 Tax=Frankliniella fusca TaxID=407009 RepID=A0AAE1HMN8_9NEOP|nr:Integral membrane protein DGCR2/IDD [Frankliniella fusca]